MKVFVTGADGNVGGGMARYLAQNGWEVSGLVYEAAAPAGVHAVREDIVKDSFVDDVASAIGSCQIIVHAAASLSRDPWSHVVVNVNCLGTLQVLRLAAALRPRLFIYISGVPVIGRPRVLPITEEHPTSPETLYHATKLFGEHATLTAAIPDVTMSILRLPSPVGPDLRHSGIFTGMIREALSGKPIRLNGKGTRRQNYIDIRDIARAVMACAERIGRGIFNIAAAQSVSNCEFARLCVETLNSSSPIEYSGEPDPEDNIFWDISIAKARTELGFEPRIPLRQSMLDWVERHASGSHQ